MEDEDLYAAAADNLRREEMNRKAAARSRPLGYSTAAVGGSTLKAKRDPQLCLKMLREEQGKLNGELISVVSRFDGLLEQMEGQNPCDEECDGGGIVGPDGIVPGAINAARFGNRQVRRLHEMLDRLEAVIG